MNPETFTTNGVAWVSAVAGILIEVCGKLGILAAAYFGLLTLWKKKEGEFRNEIAIADIRRQQDIDTERLDRHRDEIDQVAGAVSAQPAVQQVRDAPVLKAVNQLNEQLEDLKNP